MDRTIILHYHLFKNAGTSVDEILKRNFGDRWVTREFPAMGGNNTALVEDWIRETPGAVAYSSHTMMGPVPRVEGVEVIPFMLLRDPIERIKSAYRFERTQQADTWGAQLAKEHDFEGYVRARLARPNDRQCRNFQTYRLASLCPGDAPELDRALEALAMLRDKGVIGRVEAFDEAIFRLTDCLNTSHPNFLAEAIKSNVSSRDLSEADCEALGSILLNVNSDDFRVWEYAEQVVQTELG